MRGEVEAIGASVASCWRAAASRRAPHGARATCRRRSPSIRRPRPAATAARIALGLAVGAALGPSGPDNALWFPSSIATRADGSTAVYPHIVLDRAKPGLIAVERRRHGGSSTRRSPTTSSSARCIAHARPRPGLAGLRSRLHPALRPRADPAAHAEPAQVRRERLSARGADDRRRWPRQIGVPAASLEATVARCNGFAESGVDEDFGKGGNSTTATTAIRASGRTPASRRSRGRRSTRSAVDADAARHRARPASPIRTRGSATRGRADPGPLRLRQRHASGFRLRVSRRRRAARPGHDLRLDRRAPRRARQPRSTDDLRTTRAWRCARAAS